MMVWIFKMMGLSESMTSEWVEKLTRIRIIVSAVFYTVMVFIVIFGISGDVYAGFPVYVPYVIMAIFLFMAFIRMYQCMVDEKYIKRLANQKAEGNDKKKKTVSPETASDDSGKTEEQAEESAVPSDTAEASEPAELSEK